MTEQEIEELLGAYALDAVDPEERDEIEAHLLTCPRCRAEVAAHREVATLLANGGATAPEGLWNRIAGELSPEAPVMNFDAHQLIDKRPFSPQRRRQRRVIIGGATFAAAAAVIVIALLFVQVADLNRQIHPTGTNRTGITAAVNFVLAQPHRTIVLTSADHAVKATMVIAPDGNAYWTGSNLAVLPRSKTYQLWTVVRGNMTVSLGVIGASPSTYGAFRLQPDMHRLMVTVEPQGGTTVPTSPVLVSAAV